jgi:transcriptional regulator with XRE-family HTH domain
MPERLEMGDLIFDSNSILALRRRHGLSMQGFGDKIGVHRNLVNDWEKGRVKPSMATIEKIIRAFDLKDVNYFFCQQTNMRTCLEKLAATE